MERGILRFLIAIFLSNTVYAAGYHEPEFFPTNPSGMLNEKTLDGLQSGSLQISEIFADASDLSALRGSRTDRPKHIPFGAISDSANMLGLSIQMERRAIPKNTLIIHDSGHSIPVAAYMMRKFIDQYTIQAIFYFPSELNQNPGIRKRLAFHARSWGEDLAALQVMHAEKGQADIVFLGLEAHRKERGPDYLVELPIQSFPDSRKLRSLGIQQVVLMTEAHPDADPETINILLRSDTKAYLDSLDLPVTYLGNDCRRETQCWDIIGQKTPHGKFGIF